MQIDLKTVSIKPQRNAFDHLVARFGDKQMNRYQEGTYDIQPDANLQYRPTWDPQHQLYDPGRTGVEMQDWYVFKDPRQYFYGAYTMARARQQESTEDNFAFFESRRLAETIPAPMQEMALELLVPLRHVAWGANLNNTSICADGYGTAITQACMYQAMDNLGIAQYLTRVGLSLDNPDYIDLAKERWLTAEAWQPLRRYVENMLIIEDWFELYTAQNLVLDGLLYPLVYEKIVDQFLAAQGGAPIAMLTAFMSDWFRETRRWVDSVIKLAAEESTENRELLHGWIDTYRPLALDALGSAAHPVVESSGRDLIAEIDEEFAQRLQKIGLAKPA